MAPFYKEGVHWGKINAQEFSATKNDNPQLVLGFGILGIVDRNEPDGPLLQCPPGSRTCYITITEKTIEFVMEDLKVLEYDKPSFKYLDPSIPGGVSFVGRELAFLCLHRDDGKGGLKEKWSIYRRRDRSGPIGEPLEDKAIRNLDNLFGKQLKTLAKADPPAPAREKIAGQGLGVPASQTAQALEHAAATGERDPSNPCPF